MADLFHRLHHAILRAARLPHMHVCFISLFDLFGSETSLWTLMSVSRLVCRRTVGRSVCLSWLQVLLLCSSWSICFRIMPGTLWLLSVVRAGEGGICANPRDFAAPRDLKNICTRRDNNNVINIQEVYIYPSIAETMSALALRVQKGSRNALLRPVFF